MSLENWHKIRGGGGQEGGYMNGLFGTGKT